VEMEALTAVSVAALTVYDMVGLDPNLDRAHPARREVRRKSGTGMGGAARAAVLTVSDGVAAAPRGSERRPSPTASQARIRRRRAAHRPRRARRDRGGAAELAAATLVTTGGTGSPRATSPRGHGGPRRASTSTCARCRSLPPTGCSPGGGAGSPARADRQLPRQPAGLR
jgi:hypothetical protein